MAVIRPLALRLLAPVLLVAGTGLAAADGDDPRCVPATDAAEWAHYKQLFMSDEGRIIDTGNQGVSHSEGQGFAMRLAFHYGQRDDFARIWQWTQDHLLVRDDHLAAWRWRPDQTPAIDDKNNATDGDLFIAWALALAGQCWDQPGYRDAAQRIAQDIRSKLIERTDVGHLLLPGADGFVHGDRYILNPSYWVFPAFADLAQLDGNAPEWAALATDGRALIDQLQFGRWKLVPDWVQWSPQSGFALAEPFAPRFGYDAIRVPLYLIWDAQNAQALSRLAGYWNQQTGWPWRPDWVDLETDAISSYGAPPGIAAVAGLTRFAVASADGASPGAFLAVPSLARTDGIDYYSASLSLLSRIAAQGWCRQHGCTAIDR